MQYTSTRNESLRLEASKCLLNGISEDGGLYVPTEFPQISICEIEKMAQMSYQERAYAVLSRYMTDFSSAELHDCIESAYKSFDEKKVVPLHYLNEQTAVMELFHGPTLAFKDVALQILPHFLKYAKKKQNEHSDILILVATSGDTGKAALEGFCDVDGMRIGVFFPSDGVSRMQRLQMITQEGKNVFVCAVKGNFDDAQTGVKAIFADKEIRKKLLEANIKLSSANSINWGRLVPQIVYYFSAYADLLADGKIKSGEKINFVVPTGNFGDILAGYYASQMGLPVKKFICASNKNNVLTEFFDSGKYNANREFFKTMSPSMDILISSNLERLLFALCNKNGKKVSELMGALKQNGEYSISPEMHTALCEKFDAEYTSEEETGATIKRIFEQYGYCVDTHTAVALGAQQKYAERSGDQTVTVVLSTASPYKFPFSVLTALKGSALADEFEDADALAAMGIKMPEQITALKNKKVLHTGVCEKTELAQRVLNEATK